MKRLFGNLASIFGFLLAVSVFTDAAQLKEARVTQVVNDVKLLPEQAAPRPAAVSDLIRDGTAVRTGTQSRSELTFTDLTITRLGANTIFSFNEGTREMNLKDGAILFQVPKGAGGATIKTAAVTAAVTGTTGIGEAHPPTANNPHPIGKWFCLEGNIRLFLPNGEWIELLPGKMVVTDGTSFAKVDFDIGKLVNSSPFFTGYSTPIASLPLINFEMQKQLELLISGGFVYTNLVGFLDPTSQQEFFEQIVNAQESNPAVADLLPSPSTPTPTPVMTPTPAMTPSKFGALTVITSPDPYLITSGTTIQTDPSITTNGQTNFGKIWRGQAQDGPLSAFIFGSTSAFDTASGFDAELRGDQGGGAGFKFNSLRLTGNPTISTTGGSVNLGLIAVNGITSGGPGGVLTFAGIRGLLLATQNGSITLGPEISFSGLRDINFYARGAGSMLTLACDVSTTNQIRLWGEGGIQLSGDLSTRRLLAFSGGDLNFNPASGAINFGGDVSLTTRASDVGAGANIVVMSGGNTTIGGALTALVDNSNGGQIGTGGNISFTTGGNLNADSIDALVNNRNGGSIGSGGNITFNIGGALTTTGDASFITSNRNDGNGGGTIGANVVLTLQAASASVGGFFLADISTNAGGNIPSATLNIDVAGNLSAQGVVQIDIQNTGFNAFGGPFLGGGTIGADATLNLTANSISTGDILAVEIVNRGDGHIGGDAIMNIAVTNNLNVQADAFLEIVNTAEMSGSTLIDGGTIVGDATASFVAGNVTTGGILELGVLNNDNRFLNGAGQIGGNANVTFEANDVSSTGIFNLVINNSQGSIGGASSIGAIANSISTDDIFFAHIFNDNGATGGDVSVSVATTAGISTGSDTIFEISNLSGAISGNTTLNVNAAGISSGGILFAVINNTGGSIDGDATINMNVSGNATATTDATIQIAGGGVAGAAAINFNGGNYDAGGTFFNAIDSDGTIAFNSASLHADVLKVGVFGTNGVVNVDGGTLSADTTLKLYVPGSNGQLNFVSDVTLGGAGAKILAANSVTIFNGVTVTIGGTNPADVFTNNANYSASFGGNDSTTGTFAGAGANNPQPLANAPPFNPAPPPALASARPAGSRVNSRSSFNQRTAASRANVENRRPNPRAAGTVIRVSDSGELLSLLDRTASGPGGKIAIPASNRTRDRRNPNQIKVADRLNADRDAKNIRNAPLMAASRLP